MREIKSFVKRSSRITKAQKKALQNYWHEYGIDIETNNLDFRKIFNNNHPVVLDIGFGNGESIIKMAKSNLNFNYIGIEVYEAGIGKLINDAKKNLLTNIKIIKNDAVEVLKNNISDFSLSAVNIFFPDPWHKKRHHKRRLINEEFLKLLTRKLMPNAYLHIATDWQEYADEIIFLLSKDKNFKNIPDKEFAIKNLRPQTKFELRGMRLGHSVWDIIFSKC